ncbi:VOC family protein, partial [Mesorhizobium sp. M8A.F.Ca.ET.202.01.1.1]|uniref:VOC family protein n=1 Tax=Mesorhizobium sp. M8A.F.Ca.ET.202.01.1.1 TaxID=2563967 RepID=UPI0032AFD1F0
MTVGAFAPRLCRQNGLRGEELALSLNRIVLYVRNVESAVAFYERHFGFQAHREQGDRIV